MFSQKKHSKHLEDSSSDFDAELLKNNASPFHGEIEAPHALTANEVLFGAAKKTEDIPMSGAGSTVSPFEALREKVNQNASDKKELEKKKALEEKQKLEAKKKAEAKPTRAMPKSFLQRKPESSASLLEKCMPYITEGGGEVEEEKPTYTLDSIDSIIYANESKAKELLKKLNGMGIDNDNIVFDDLSRKQVKTPAPQPTPVTPQPAVTEKVSEPTVILPKVTEKAEEKAPEKPEYKTAEIPMKPDPAFTISDIDTPDDLGKTVSFQSFGPEQTYEDIVSGTRILDLQEEIFETDKSEHHRITTQEALAPEQFRVEDDYMSAADTKRVGMALLKKSRSAGIKLIFTFLTTLALFFLLIPGIHAALYENQNIAAAVSVCIYSAICLINYDVFVSIKTLFTPRPAPESAIGVSTLISFIFVLFCLKQEVNPYSFILCSAITLFLKCIAVSMRNTYTLNNFRVIAARMPKRAIKFEDDRQITFAMAKNSVEGDALIGMSVKCESVQEYLKHTYIDSVMNGILRRFTAIALISGAIISVGIGIYSASLFGAVRALCIVSSFTFAPTILFTDILPLMRASNKLNKKGAMIAGAAAAREIELANAVAVKSVDLFPKNTVVLQSMQAIGETDINRALYDVTAILKQTDSPLYDIFTRIVKADAAALPIADTIKYEDRMGISGWVQNRHIFIGNRTLLTAHGIKTPILEVDKNILRSNAFPVYIAVDDKPCALLSVRYNVDTSIAEELKKLSSSGVMILVDSCDQNVTTEMVCDYFGLFEGSAYVMGSSGSELYHNVTNEEDGFSSGAAYRDNSNAIFDIFNRAAKIKKTVSSLTVYHIIASFLLAAVFLYSTLTGHTPAESGTIPIYLAASLVISYIVSLFNK